MHKDHVTLLFTLLLAVLCIYDVTARSLPHSSSSFRTKRQFGDLTLMDLQSRLGLKRLMPNGCVEVACGLVDLSGRSKRISSDQRMAQLQALLGMSYPASSGVGHGLVNVDIAGKRKRSEDDLSQDERLLRIMERLSTYMTGGASSS